MNTKILPPAQGAFAYPLLIKSLLLAGPRTEPDHEIVYSDRIRYDYRTLLTRIAKLANVLTEAGIGPGDTVAVMDWDSHRYLEAYFAIPMLGAVIHHVNIRLSPEQILYTLKHAEDNLLLVHDDFLVLAETLYDSVPSLRGCIQLSDESQAANTSLQPLGEYEALLAGASDQYEFADFSEDSVATTFYTTGTTGNPKGVYFSHRQLVLHTLNMAVTLGCHQGQPLLRSHDVYMPMTPMFHVHAWGVPYVATMLGAKQVYPGRYEPNKLVQLFAREQVTFSHGVPTVLQMILDCEAARETDLSGWKMLTGGSAPTLGMAQQMAERGIEFFTAYGMSETCPLLSATYLRQSDLAQPMTQQLPQRVKTGMPVGLVDLKIISPDGQALPHDGEAMGEVVVRAPWLTQGYYREPEKGDELWQGGWLHTGDVAAIGTDGMLQIKDRIKDVIKTGGEWVSSLALENLISQCPAVAQVAVVGIPDPQWGERPYALIVPTQGSDVDIELIQQHLQQYVDRGEIAKWAMPDQISLVDEIPKTSVGKINKKLIRQQMDA